MDIVREWNEKRSPGEFQKPPPRAPKFEAKKTKTDDETFQSSRKSEKYVKSEES